MIAAFEIIVDSNVSLHFLLHYIRHLYIAFPYIINPDCLVPAKPPKKLAFLVGVGNVMCVNFFLDFKLNLILGNFNINFPCILLLYL